MRLRETLPSPDGVTVCSTLVAPRCTAWSPGFHADAAPRFALFSRLGSAGNRDVHEDGFVDVRPAHVRLFRGCRRTRIPRLDDAFRGGRHTTGRGGLEHGAFLLGRSRGAPHDESWRLVPAVSFRDAPGQAPTHPQGRVVADGPGAITASVQRVRLVWVGAEVLVALLAT